MSLPLDLSTSAAVSASSMWDEELNKLISLPLASEMDHPHAKQKTRLLTSSEIITIKCDEQEKKKKGGFRNSD